MIVAIEGKPMDDSWNATCICCDKIEGKVEHLRSMMTLCNQFIRWGKCHRPSFSDFFGRIGNFGFFDSPARFNWF
jgi:hypothetical protein